MAMLRYLKLLQKAIIFLLLTIISIILVIAIVNVFYETFTGLFTQPISDFISCQVTNLFSLFLVILIGIELLEAVKAFLKEDIVHVEIVVLVAIIAIARKVIVWDFKGSTAMDMIGLAIMVFALSISFFLIKTTDMRIRLSKSKKKIEKPKEPEGNGSAPQGV
jgi:uncharacterized membrane protein (DUF373 family)